MGDLVKFYIEGECELDELSEVKDGFHTIAGIASAVKMKLHMPKHIVTFLGVDNESFEVINETTSSASTKSKGRK